MKNETYRLTKEEHDNLEEYVEKRWKGFSNKGKMKESTKKDNIKNGMAGEIGFRHIVQSEIIDEDPLLRGKRSHDFILKDGKKVDVKTLEAKDEFSYKRWVTILSDKELSYNKNYPKPDYFALMLYDKETQTVKYKGMVTSREAYDNLHPECRFGVGVQKDWFLKNGRDIKSGHSTSV